MSSGAALLVIWLTVFVINLRHVMYAASIAPHFQKLPLYWRLCLPFLMADQPYALGVIRYVEEPQMKHKEWFFLGMGGPLWLMWTLATVVGVFVGAQIPPEWALDFVIPLVFLVILFPSIKDNASVVAAVVAGAVAVLARPLPYNLGLMTAAVVGIVAGVVAEGVLNKVQSVNGLNVNDEGVNDE
jgi:predicted branched-subunit amino acid permease